MTVKIPLLNSTEREQLVIFEPLAEPLTLAPLEGASVWYQVDSLREFDLTVEFHETGCILMHSSCEFKVVQGTGT